MKITAQRKIAKSCLIALPLFKAITNHSSRYSWFVNWWEQRDLNPPQRISSGTAHVSGQGFQDATGRRSSWSSTSANPLVFIPVQLEPAILPSYTILPYFIHKISSLPVGEHAFGVAVSSCATSNVDYQFSSKHVSLSSW